MIIIATRLICLFLEACLLRYMHRAAMISFLEEEGEEEREDKEQAIGTDVRDVKVKVGVEEEEKMEMMEGEGDGDEEGKVCHSCAAKLCAGRSAASGMRACRCLVPLRCDSCDLM